MMNFDFNSDEFNILIQSVMTRIDFIKEMLSNLSKEEEIYQLYVNELSTLHSLLAKFFDTKFN